MGVDRGMPDLGLTDLFERHLEGDQLEAYRLPVADQRARVIVGLSGGADSSVLALFAAAYLKPHYADIEFLFTDTQAEPQSCYATLDKIERVTGIPVRRITPSQGLFSRIEHYNGFLPNSRQRWCTRELKVEPLLAYMAEVKAPHGIISLAGIRADEPDREGISLQYAMEQEQTGVAFPFVDLGITKRMVFDILDNSIGIPGTYAYRSRSGCYSCFFQRNQEIFGMLQHDPEHFAHTESFERLSPADRERWSAMPPTLEELGIRGYYPVPAFVDIRKPEKVPAPRPATPKQNADQQTADFWGKPEALEDAMGTDLFVGVAIYTDERLGWFGGRAFTPGVYNQQFVTLSTSLTGLKSSLGTWCDFKAGTPMPGVDHEDLQLVIAQLRFPPGTVDARAPGKESFTWKNGVAYQQLRHLAKHCQATLQHIDLQRQLEDAVDAMHSAGDRESVLDAEERAEQLTSDLNKAPAPPGELIWEGLYVPQQQESRPVQLVLVAVSEQIIAKTPRENLEFDEVPRACLVCSM